MKSFFKKMAIMLICMSIFLSYMPWNVVFAADEIAETPQNVITEEPQGSGEATNPEEGNTQLENPKSNAEITEELQGEPSQGNEDFSVGKIVKNVKDKVQNVLKSGQAPAKTPKNPEDYFIFNESTNTITGYSSSLDAPKDIKIPATINGVNVEHIGNNAFSGQQLTGLSFELPSNLKSIGDSAFNQNQSLKGSVTIPNGVTSIGNNAFQRCSSLLSVTIPDGVKDIGDYAFSDCSSLKSITIPDSVTSIGDYAFFGCISLSSITIPESVTSIGDYAFFKCDSLSSITIPEGVTSIGDYAFSGCRSLTSMTIPDNVTSIGRDAFDRTTNLKKIDIPGKTRGEIAGEPWGASCAVYWKDTAVSGDYIIDTSKGEIIKYIGNEEVVDIPSAISYQGKNINIKSIAVSAFANGKGVKSITIPDSVISIGNGAFSGCSSLTSVNIPNGVTSIESRAFSKCSSLTSINIQEGVRKIYFAAFSDCYSLTNVTFPKSLESVETYAFGNNRNLKKVYILGKASLGENVFANTTIDIYCNFGRTIDFAKNQPWGAKAGSKVYYKGEYIGCQTSVSKVNGEYKRKIHLSAEIDRNNGIIKSVKLPDGSKLNIGNYTWEKDYDVTQNGKYTFTFADGNGKELSYDVNISDIGAIELTAKSANINPEKVASLTKSELLKLIEASASDDAGGLACDISDDALNKVKALKEYEGVSVKVTAKNKFGIKEKIVNIVALPDVIPGSKEKPAGYVTVTFAKGEHGSLTGEMSQHVNPGKEVDLKAVAPKVTADTGFKHTGWDKALKAKFDKDTTVTATYEALPDTVPGSKEKPAGYVTVTFAKGEHGSLSGETSQHVNPAKVVDLKTLAPKVTADVGFKHTGWNSELKKKFTEDTTITATYEALPDTVPGSQEKPAGYVTVTFAKGEHGSLTGEMSQHVNPGKEVDLKAVAPKVTADVGFKHTGWNSELKKKFTEDTTITATYKAATEKFAITIDPDGGNWNGSTDPIVYNAKIGEYITLPDAPTKEGYTFKYWKGSKYMPGDRYKVEGEHKFTAVWEKKDTSKTDDSSTGTTGTSGTAGANGANTNKTSTSNHAPFTADSQNIMLYLMMSIFSFVLILRLRSQEN